MAASASIDRELLRNLDLQLRGAHEEGTVATPAPDLSLVQADTDISVVLEAVQLAASTMSDMAEHIRALEVHHQDLATSSEALEADSRKLESQLKDVIQQREALASSLMAKSQDVNRLESLTANHVSRATGLKRDLDVTRADLAKLANAVTTALGAVVRA